MSMLNRFRKQGGFQQLLALIETCDPDKQKNLLHLVGTEDPGWAHLVKVKALNLDRILSWPQEIILEIAPHVPDKILATLCVKLNMETQSKLLVAVPNLKGRELRELSTALKPTAAEYHAAVVMLIKTVRDLETRGKIRFVTFDPSLVVDQKIAA